MDGGEFAALYTLQHSLPGYTEKLCGLKHRDVSFGRLFNEAGTQLLCDADAPWRPRSDLFTGNKAVSKPSMKGGWGKPERFGGFLDRDQFDFLGSEGRLESRDLPIAAKISDLVCREAVPMGCASALAVYDTGDDAV